MGHRRKSTKNELFDMLFELTGMLWQTGAVITGLLIILAFLSLRWVIVQNTALAASLLLRPLAESLGWFFYLLPLSLLALAWQFGKKTYQSYCEQNHF